MILLSLIFEEDKQIQSMMKFFSLLLKM